jgi:hypothetical protein
MASVPVHARSGFTTEVDAFLAEKRAAQPRSPRRLIFALDATMSRQPTWDLASQLQSEMFEEVAAIGDLSVRLVFYYGFGRCQQSPWIADSRKLASMMRRITCEAGVTQIHKVLTRACEETKIIKVAALVFVGDAVDGDNASTLAKIAKELGQLHTPVFMFQEGDDGEAEEMFRMVAKLSRGAYSRFDPGSAKQLAALLRAVAAFAAGRIKALAGRKDAAAVLLLEQMR